MKKSARYWLAAASLGAFALPSLAAQYPVVASIAPEACNSLASAFDYPDVELSETRAIAAVDGKPARCEARGAISGNIRFVAWLPNDWNGRYLMVGNGGKAGIFSLDAMEGPLSQGFATITTDTGHDNEIEAQGGARFGSDLKMEIDFAYRAVNLTAGIGKRLVAAAYDRKPDYSYWVGCSTGGRQGLIQAQRYPTDFDGYVIGAPVAPYTRTQMAAPAYLGQLYKGDPRKEVGLITTEEARAVGNAVMAKCDAIDGLEDGLLDDPRMCTFDPAKDLPKAQGESPRDGTAFSEEQIAALQAIYEGVSGPDGTPIVNGLPVGSENVPTGWDRFLTRPKDEPGFPALHLIVADAFNWLMFKEDRPDFNYLTDFDFAVHPAEMEYKGQIYNAFDPDLDDMRKLGGRILLYHGWADTGSNPMNTLEYYQSVLARLKEQGAADPVAAADEFLRLYMMPGVAHCTGGTGFDRADWLTPLTTWVEAGEKPRAILATREAGGSRPHCPYPQTAKYQGSGDVLDAASFKCE